MKKKLDVCFVVWCLAAVLVHVGEAQTTQQPHVVFVMADDLGFHDVGYHGSEIKTPNIDKISEKGIRLENYYVQPTCTPSRSQLMSGRYQIHTGLQHGVIKPAAPNALPLGSPTLADKMRQSGYATYCVGKWHLGFYKTEYIPINRGFDTFFGHYSGGEDYFTHKRDWLNGKPYLDLHDQDQPAFNYTGTYSTHLFTSKAIERIQMHDKSKPMFLYLPYQAVHFPMQAPDEYVQPYTFIKNKRRRIYAGMVAALDEGVGNVTKALQEAGMWDNTIFIFSTDNGGMVHAGGNNYPLRGWKTTLWEGGIHGVGFVHAPNMSTSGTVNKALIHVSDWYPTIVGLAGGALNDTQPLDGYDQWKTISEGQSSPRKVLLHNIDPRSKKVGTRLYTDTFDNRVRSAIRSGDWKLITGDPGPDKWAKPPTNTEHVEYIPVKHHDKPNKNLWLFNITADPAEHNDVSATHPDVVKQLLDLLRDFNATAVPSRYPPVSQDSDPAAHGGVWEPWE